MVLAGAGALVAGALLYSYINGDEEAETSNELQTDLTQIAGVERDASGTIKLQNFLEIFKLVTKHSKKRIITIKQDFAEDRRKCLREGNEDKYREIVTNQMSMEEKIYQEVATEVMDHFDISEQEFMTAQQVHMTNPMFQQQMMQMQMGMDDEDPTWKPTIDKAKAVEIFKFVEELKFKTMEKLAQGPDPRMGGDQMEATIRMLVEHAKVGDQLFEKFNVEEEEFTKCIKAFDLMKDPEIVRLMQENMQKMDPATLQMMGGGMGGPM